MHSHASFETIADEIASTSGLHEVMRKSKEIKDNKLTVLAARGGQRKGNKCRELDPPVESKTFWSPTYSFTEWPYSYGVLRTP